jgi:hypothetical protein
LVLPHPLTLRYQVAGITHGPFPYEACTQEKGTPSSWGTAL